MLFFSFKHWLSFQETTIDPEFFDTSQDNTLFLTLNDQDKITKFETPKSKGKPYFALDLKSKIIYLIRISPLSNAFKKIIQALKAEIKDIEGFLVSSGDEHQKENVKFWMSHPEVNLYDKMPEFLYHGTSSQLYEKYIKDHGLKPRRTSGSSGSYGSTIPEDLSQSDLVYLSVNHNIAALNAAEEAAEIHGGDPVVLKIKISGLDLEKFRPDEDSKAVDAAQSLDYTGTVAYQGYIPKENISVFMIKTN